MTYPLVYLATNKVNGKRYVGVTSRAIEARRRDHERDAARKRGGAPRFHAALRKYGFENFDWAVLAVFVSADEALKGEARYIAQIEPEYNITAGGRGALGMIWTPDMRARQSARRKGIVFTEEHKAKLRAARARQVCTQETRNKRAAALARRNRTPEHRAKVSAGKTGKPGARGWKKSPEAVHRGWETRRRNQEAAGVPAG